MNIEQAIGELADTVRRNQGAVGELIRQRNSALADLQTMTNECDNYKRWYHEEEALKVKAHRRINALKGVITRMKARNEPRAAKE